MTTKTRLRGISGLALAITLAAALPAAAQSGAVADRNASAAVSGQEDSGDVTVTATRTEKPVEEVPATVSVITAREIDDHFVADIKDLVRYEPGVAVRRAPARFTAAGSSTGRDRDSGFNIRGLEGNRVLITVDGVRVPDAFSFGAQSVGRGDYVDLDLLKSVEILRGPASALYGSDGVAGAVSFITKDPADFLKTGQSLGGGVRLAYDSSDDSFIKGVVAAGRTGDVSLMVAYTRRDGHELENKGENDSANTDRTTPNPQDVSSNAVLARLVWAPDDANRIRLTYERFDSHIDTDVLSAIAKPPLSTTSTLSLNAIDKTNRDRATLDYRYTGDGVISGIRAAGYYQKSGTNQTAFEDRNTAADRVRIDTFDNEVYGGMLQLESRAAFGEVKNLFVYGADYSHTRQSGERDGTVPPVGETFPTRAFPTTDYTLVGVFAQDEITIADGLVSLFPAVRFDHYKLDPKADPLFTAFVPAGQSGSRVTPRVGVIVKPVELVRVFANYTRGFKPPEPSQVNNGFFNPVQSYMSIPNPDLRPETSESFEGGVRLVAPRWSLGVTGFTSRFRNFIDQVQVGGEFGDPTNPALFQYVNLGRVKIEGVEAKGEARLANGLGLRAALSYAKGTVRTAGEAGSAPLDSVEPFKFVGGLFYQPEDGPFRAELIATHSAGKQLSDTNNVCNSPARPSSGPGDPGSPGTQCFTPSGFWTFDATASLRVRDHATIRAGVFNITDRKYFWYSDVRGLTSTSPVRDAYSQPGRNAGVSLTLTY